MHRRVDASERSEPPFTTEFLLRMQRTAGNQAVLRLLRSRQTRLQSTHQGVGPIGSEPVGSLKVEESSPVGSAGELAVLAERLRKRANAARQAGQEELAEALIVGAHELLADDDSLAAHLVRCALRLWVFDGRRWGRAKWWRRLWSWLLWVASLGRLGGPWLHLSCSEYEPVPLWRSKAPAFLAEVVFAAHGLVLRIRPSRPWPGRWSVPTVAQWELGTGVPGQTVETGSPGDVWSAGRRAGIVLVRYEGVTLGVSFGAAIDIEVLPGAARFRRIVYDATEV